MSEISPPNHSALYAAMHTAVELQRGVRVSHGPVNAETRIHRLARLYALLSDNKQTLIDTIQADFSHRSYHQTLMSDFYATMHAIRHAQRRVRKWMKPEKRNPGFPMSLFGARAHVRYEAKGVVGIMGTWNFPINTVFAPLAGAFAAGNSAVLKFSEITPLTGALLESLTGDYFTPMELAGFNGDAEVGADFASLPLDHLLFTGSGAVGKQVMIRAAQNLTPVTLELGGKSPVIISRRCDLDEAVLRIVSGKMLNAGQVCLSPDYVFVPREWRDTFVRLYEETIERLFPTLLDNPDYCAVVNQQHFNRLNDLINDAAASRAEVLRINPAGEDFDAVPGNRKMKPAVIIEPTENMRVMREEIFGPVLVVKAYDEFERCIAYINEHPRPLGLYYFGDDPYELKLVLDHTHSGGVTINDVMSHVSCEDLPFGGTGASGMGNYHGFEGFRTFSHARAVYRQSNKNLAALAGMLPPYDEKCEDRLNSMTK